MTPANEASETAKDLVERLRALTSPEAEYMPDGPRLSELRRDGRDAAAEIERLQAALADGGAVIAEMVTTYAAMEDGNGDPCPAVAKGRAYLASRAVDPKASLANVTDQYQEARLAGMEEVEITQAMVEAFWDSPSGSRDWAPEPKGSSEWFGTREEFEAALAAAIRAAAEKEGG